MLENKHLSTHKKIAIPLSFRPTDAYTEVQSCSSCATDAVAGVGNYLYGPGVVHTRQLGYKQFELSNHTGNILSVITDRKNAVDIGIWVQSTRSFNTGSTDNRLDYYVADVVEVTDYYPGGMPMPGRSVPDMQFRSFKWGHNGQHNDDEIYGKGNTRMAEFREYDARLMRRWNTDPMAHAGQSLYEAFYSNPIAFADPLGLKPESGDEGGPGSKTPMGWPEKGQPVIIDIEEIIYPNNKDEDQSNQIIYYGHGGSIIGQKRTFGETKEYYVDEYQSNKLVLKNTKNGVETNPDVINKVQLPPKDLREKIYTGLTEKHKEDNMREYAGYIGVNGYGKMVIVWAKPGKRIDLVSNPEDGEIDPFDSEDVELASEYQKVIYIFHLHPGGTYTIKNK